MLKLTFFRWNNNLVMSKMMQRTVESSMSKEKTLINVSALGIYGTNLNRDEEVFWMEHRLKPAI